jgi:phosphohistidine phosphatase
MDVMTSQRQLIVMRHAKAGELPGGPDAERPLRPRGRRNAAAAGAWLASRDLVPDRVLCSTAKRARQTWQCVSAELAGEPELVSDERLYDASGPDLLDIFAETDPGVRSLMYVGHNPAAADVAEILTGTPVPFPTAAMAVLSLGCGWDDLHGGSANGSAELAASWVPRADAD